MVEAGNQASQFAEKGAKIVIVIDNASFPKKEESLKILKQKCLIFIYKFSPNTAQTII